MAQYLLSVHMVEGEPAPSEQEMQQMYKDTDAVNKEMQEKGVWVYANGLQPADIATVVKEQNNTIVTTDGRLIGLCGYPAGDFQLMPVGLS